MEPVIYDARASELWPTNFPSHVLKMIEALQRRGYQAYIVGGGIRDQLMSLHPKDFDLVTDALPEQIKKCFDRAIIIGKRFKLVHVYFDRRDYIEVATFRQDHSLAKHKSEGALRQGGIVSRDNVYGTIEDDALRRDFTVNAFYYNPGTHELMDFSNGIKDFQARILRLIGEPDARLKEDPVRILRALRISNKLDFTIDEATFKAIPQHIDLLSSIAGGRLFDEYQKILLYGQAEKNFDSLQTMNILPILFPTLVISLKVSWFSEMVRRALRNTDERYYAKKTINPAFLIGVFLWQELQACKKKLAETMSYKKAYQDAVKITLGAQNKITSMPRFMTEMIEEVWALQRQLELRREKNILGIVNHPRYRAAYDFLLLRSEVGQVKSTLCQWWEKLYLMSTNDRAEFVEKLLDAK
ncbi:MAG: polynucleotide adenylyltransferase PcnB [Gammaproteobacteria bacterium]|nr:polynucleotide adenylyltransferase PcnB [Gammaproteobacteria bacterium]